MTSIAFGYACMATKSRRKILDKTLLLSAAAIALIASPAANANPAGGAVTTGSASISASSNKTNVNQKSEDVVIDWSSFNVGTGQTTQFVQPNAQAIAVNRIGGASASQILGTLDANGRVVLINGNGLVIGKGAQVNVGSLIATSTDGSDSDLLSGKFTQAGKQNASVVNNGAITAASGGVVALVAPNVTNTGTVNAKLGTVALGAANKFTVDFTGDGLVSFAAQGDVNARASAINSGLLSGANVSMTAHAANGIATGIVNMSGIITAQGVQNVGGTIYLNAGNGTLTTTGTLNAAGATGDGTIETSGQTANISGHITAGRGGQWKVDPEDLTIDSSAATTIDGALNGDTSVLEQTTSGAASGSGTQAAGAGDINVESGLSWNTSAMLTLDAYHSLNIEAPITITGAGHLVLQYNGAATDGTLAFSANAAFTDVVDGTTQGSLTINGTGFTLANSIAQLASDVANFSGSGFYALANSYDASGDNGGNPYTSFIIGGMYRGMVEGLGNTISNLSIDTVGIQQVGLFSLIAGGTVRDLGLIDVNIVASDSGSNISAGAFAGANVGGTLLNDWATGTISGGSGSHDLFGGLAGDNVATIENSHAEVAVTDSFSGAELGGLAGFNGGTISETYAGGTVTGGSGASAGGLVGLNTGTISQSYATGVVTGGISGGLVGGDDGTPGDITSSYWDLQTSGITNPSQGAGDVSNDSGITGETTAGLQGTLPSSFSSSVWGTGPGLYPYLIWQFGGTPQVVSGIAYKDAGVTADAGDPISALMNGNALDSALTGGGVTTGANGYYYILLAPGTISGSAQVLAYSPLGAALAENASGSVANANIYGNALDDLTAASTYSAAKSGYGANLATAENGNPSVATFVSGLAGYDVSSSASTFTLDLSTVGAVIADTTGNVTVSAPQSWSNANTLTLDAAGTLTIDAPISVNGAGGVMLGAGYDTTTVPGNAVLELSFGSGDNIAYATGGGEGISGQSLTINGAAYTLVYSTTDLQNINNNLNGDYALANALDLSSATNWLPLGTESDGDVPNNGKGFNGIFEGLGNTMSNFSLDLSGVSYVGLFGYAGIDSTIRDLALAGGGVTSNGVGFVGALAGDDDGIVDNVKANLTVDGSGGNVGGLVGNTDSLSSEIENSSASGTVTSTGAATGGGLVGSTYGTIVNSYATGSVTAGDGAEIGGLVGYANGKIDASYATGTVSAGANSNIGGLAGYAEGEIENSHATGNVTAGGFSDAGGLSGYAESRVTGSYASGSVNAGSSTDAGGLLGYAQSNVENSYATGDVTAIGLDSDAGGLTGYNEAEITNSYATGLASAGSHSWVGGLSGYSYGKVAQSYATGGASGGADSYVGGLVGESATSIEESYATGAVGGAGATSVGGLVGKNDSAATIAQTYATGYVAPGSGTNVGGLVGDDQASAGNITYSYWDMETSGIGSTQGAGNVASDSGITGETTTALQAGLPSGFSSSIWSIVPGVSYPYLQWQFNGTPQVVAGFTVASNGKTDVSGLDVALLVNGESVTPAVDMSSGANGYYYLLLAPGTISNSGSPVFAFLTNGTPGNSYVGNSLGGDDNLKIEEGQLRVKSGAGSVTGLFRALNSAVGDNTGADFLYTSSDGIAPGTNLFLSDSATTFNVNSALDVGAGTVWLYDPTGAISETGAGAITARLLRGNAENGVTLTGTNDIAHLGLLTNSGSGGIALDDAVNLTVVNTVNAGSGDLSLTTTEGNLDIAAALESGATTTLDSESGKVHGSGAITTQLLNVTADTGIDLTGSNDITQIGTDTTHRGPNVIDNP
jgi:trimeric autotransporter adhesin